MPGNLRPYQWQLGDTIFGKYTQYPVLGTAIASYDVNNQDYQASLSDVVQMGQDTLKGGVITFTIGVKDNAPMRYIPNDLPDDLVLKSSKLLTALQKEWKGDDVRLQWGQLKPLVYCNGYGSTRRIYGRPRKFQYSPKTEMSQFHTVSAEYARIDTLTYTDVEYEADLVLNANAVNYTRSGGDADAWYRVLLTGPMQNPVIIVGGNHIQLGPMADSSNFNINSGVQVEVSSYPWERRIIDSNNINWRTALVGDSKYLDQFLLAPDTPYGMQWTASETSGASRCQVLWRDAYHVL